MRRATRHSYLTKARDDFGVAFFITLCGRHLPEDSASALWIEDFEVLWENQERSGLCRHCATEMRLDRAG